MASLGMDLPVRSMATLLGMVGVGGGDLQGLHDGAAWYGLAVAWAALEGCSSAIASGRRSEAAADYGRRVWCRCVTAVPIGSHEHCCCSTETHGLRGVGALALAASEGCSVPILAGRCSGATADLGLRVAAWVFCRSWIDAKRFLRCLNAVCGTLAWRETVGQRRVGPFGHPLRFGTL